MRRIVGRDARLVVIAAVTASLTTGLVMAAPAVGGAVAAIVRNSHMVDGRHAVGAGASVKARKGKLVATSPKTGKLPSNIIATAPNARRLGGKGAATYARKAALRSPGTINSASNPVAWSKLRGVPAELMDGDDAIGPRAFAHVDDAGHVSLSWPGDWDDENVTHPASEPGVYCFDLSFEPRHVQVTIDLRRSADAVEAGVQPYATFAPGSITSGGNCGSGSTADALVVFRDGTDTRHNAAFFVSFM
jgi:hypothetical protein